MRPLSAREQRLVAIALAVAVIAVLWLGVARPIARGFADRAWTRAELTAERQRDAMLVRSASVWREAARRQTLTAADFALPADTEDAAAETLKGRLQKLASDGGFTLSGVTDLPGAAPSGAVRVRAEMQLTPTQLAESLRRLETEEPYVVVEYLSVAADRALPTGKPGPLDVRLELSAPYGAAAIGAGALGQ